MRESAVFATGIIASSHPADGSRQLKTFSKVC